MNNTTLHHAHESLDYDPLNPFNTHKIKYELDTSDSELHRGLETTVAIVLLGYLILGLSGNLLTIVALLRCPKVRNVTAAFIISLCVADCLFCVLVLPWEVSRFFAGKWVWGQGLICTVLPLIRYWNVAVSLLSIAMITINRYIMIAHYGIYKTVYKNGWIALMIAFCWLFPFCILIPTLLGKWGRFGLIEALETCSIIDENGQSPKKVLFGLGFCIPACIIIICYSLIFYVIRKSENRLRHHNIKSSSNGSTRNSGINLQPKLPGQLDKEANRKKNEWRITKMVMIIFLTFLFTYLPITLVKFFDPTADIRVLHLLGYVMVYLSCCINPIIYVIMNRQYRQAYRSVILCSRPRLHNLSSQGDKNGDAEQFSQRLTSNAMKRISFVNPMKVTNLVSMHSKNHRLTQVNNDTNVSVRPISYTNQSSSEIPLFIRSNTTSCLQRDRNAPVAKDNLGFNASLEDGFSSPKVFLDGKIHRDCQSASEESKNFTDDSKLLRSKSLKILNDKRFIRVVNPPKRF